jgi:DNA-binding PadR family transcriptional regulator
MPEDPRSFLPLSPAILHILVALAAEDRHGYGIMQEVSRQSEGRYKLGPGTLYDNLQKLLDQRLVAEVSHPDEKVASRRRYYTLTTLGRRVATAEMTRLDALFRCARPYLQIPKTRRA